MGSNLKPRYRTVYVDGERYEIYNDFKVGEKYVIMLNYTGDRFISKKELLAHYKRIDVKLIEDFNNYNKIVFQDEDTGFYLTLDIGRKIVRENARIFREYKPEQYSDVKWCTPIPSAFDDKFFVLGHFYKIKFRDKPDYLNCVLTEITVNRLKFDWYQYECSILERRNVYVHEYQYQQMKEAGSLKKNIISLNGDEWSE